MKKIAVLTAAAVIVATGSAIAFNQGGFKRIKEVLTGHKEVPVISTTGRGTFTASINKEGTEIQFLLDTPIWKVRSPSRTSTLGRRTTRAASRRSCAPTCRIRRPAPRPARCRAARSRGC